MNSQEKAKELINKFILHTRVFHEVLGWEDYIDSAKQCALIVVDEIIKEYEEKIIYAAYDTDFELWKDRQNYWKEVKQEIIKYK